MKKRLRTTVIIILIIIMVIMFSARYYLFVSNTIYSESVSHLTEIYHQANRSLNNLISSNWTNMHLWADSLALLMLGFVIRRNQLKLKKKDTEILYRDEFFSKVLVNVDDVFLMLDAEKLHVDYISPNIEKLMGIPERKARENIHELDQLVKNKEALLILDQLSAIKPGQQGEWDREYIHQRTGELRWFHVIAFCSNIQDKKKYILVMSDRTKDRNINKALEEAADAAESANRAKSTFLSNMSHDIRTPMNAIIGFATLAISNIDNEKKVKEYLSKILSSSNHLLSLINDVLDMSRIESGKIYLDETEVNLSDVLHDIKTIISGQVHAKQLELYMDTMDVMDEDVYCDKIRLNQVLLNLLSNAIKFTPPGGAISVRISQSPIASDGKGHYEIRIKDTGIGMSKEFLEHIFNPFERERISTVSKIQGTGLGMSIVKNIINMMNGTIGVKSEQGKGTEFIIHLDLRLQTKEKVDSPICNAKDYEYFKGKKILLVEDNDFNREIAAEILGDYGITVDVAENGQEAVNKVSASKPGEYNLVLMDIQMPIMDGYEATRRIRALNDLSLAAIRIVAMSANAYDEDRMAAAECGMNGFISKPINMKELDRILHGMLK